MFSKQFSDYKTTTCSNAGPLSVFAELNLKFLKLLGFQFDGFNLNW